MAMHHKSDRKARGRTSISGRPNSGEMGKGNMGPSSSKPNVPLDVRTGTNRPVTDNGGGGKHRGDRRDMSPTYSGNTKHAARGNMARKDVKTRKR